MKIRNKIINRSINERDPQLKGNYRPVSCLSAASKLLEKIVSDQVSVFFESNKVLPDNQHDFCLRRSTMTPLADIHKDRAINSENFQKMSPH